MVQEVSFGPHRFDPETGRLWAGRREVNITPRAAAVLAALIARAGQLVTRHELFRSVWGDTVVSDAALTACIQELRGALEDDARLPRFIETRHRRGYRFAARVLPSAPQGASRTPAPLHPGPEARVVGRDRELIELRACLERAERFYTAELHRQKGELLRATGHDLAGAVRWFEAAAEIARHQGAWALERRALQGLQTAAQRM